MQLRKKLPSTVPALTHSRHLEVFVPIIQFYKSNMAATYTHWGSDQFCRK